ncbi:MAG TPA: 50S ribosomal protein L6 [Gemmatales bacterium]|nr:50S ribosomal protein L6 [Lacipirellulaceae bacterium]HMP60056.1 50S ribosomal protein L6 [Gemmatales bacterium]
MSRIGKKPVVLPAGVKVAVQGQKVSVEGPKGKLALDVHPLAQIKYDDQTKTLTVARASDERLARAVHGLTRSLVNNMVMGVSTGFERKLKIEGIGYQGKIDQNAVVLTVGFSHPVPKKIPAGLQVEMPDTTTIVVKGADKQLVGQFAAELRRVRPPEPYKGKGVRYDDEVVRRKEGKSFASGG